MTDLRLYVHVRLALHMVLFRRRCGYVHVVLCVENSVCACVPSTLVSMAHDVCVCVACLVVHAWCATSCRGMRV